MKTKGTRQCISVISGHGHRPVLIRLALQAEGAVCPIADGSSRWQLERTAISQLLWGWREVAVGVGVPPKLPQGMGNFISISQGRKKIQWGHAEKIKTKDRDPALTVLCLTFFQVGKTTAGIKRRSQRGHTTSMFQTY